MERVRGKLPVLTEGWEQVRGSVGQVESQDFIPGGRSIKRRRAQDLGPDPLECASDSVDEEVHGRAMEHETKAAELALVACLSSLKANPVLGEAA